VYVISEGQELREAKIEISSAWYCKLWIPNSWPPEIQDTAYEICHDAVPQESKIHNFALVL